MVVTFSWKRAPILGQKKVPICGAMVEAKYIPVYVTVVFALVHVKLCRYYDDDEDDDNDDDDDDDDNEVQYPHIGKPTTIYESHPYWRYD